MSTCNCSRCDCELDRPHAECCNYVRSEDFVEQEPTEEYYALKHTPETRERVQEVADRTGRDFHSLAAEMARPHAQETIRVSNGQKTEERNTGVIIQTHDHEEIEFSIPMGEFEHEQVKSPAASERDEVAYVRTVETDRTVAKTGLVCPECTTEDDEILWGADQ